MTKYIHRQTHTHILLSLFNASSFENQVLDIRWLKGKLTAVTVTNQRGQDDILYNFLNKFEHCVFSWSPKSYFTHACISEIIYFCDMSSVILLLTKSWIWWYSKMWILLAQ